MFSRPITDGYSFLFLTRFRFNSSPVISVDINTLFSRWTVSSIIQDSNNHHQQQDASTPLPAGSAEVLLDLGIREVGKLYKKRIGHTAKL